MCENKCLISKGESFWRVRKLYFKIMVKVVICSILLTGILYSVVTLVNYTKLFGKKTNLQLSCIALLAILSFAVGLIIGTVIC